MPENRQLVPKCVHDHMLSKSQVYSSNLRSGSRPRKAILEHGLPLITIVYLRHEPEKRRRRRGAARSHSEEKGRLRKETNVQKTKTAALAPAERRDGDGERERERERDLCLTCGGASTGRRNGLIFVDITLLKLETLGVLVVATVLY